jgi:hypothetical protein
MNFFCCNIPFKKYKKITQKGDNLGQFLLNVNFLAVVNSQIIKGFFWTSSNNGVVQNPSLGACY